MADTRAEGRLFVLAGPDLARSFPLGERTTLGRSEECEVVLSDRSISRKHAVLVRQGERWFVQDLGSTNGVTKAGQRGERFELADGDEFKLGDLPLRFKLQAAEAAQDIEFDLGPAGPSTAVRPPAAAAPRPSPPSEPAPRAAASRPAEAREVEVEVEVDEEEIEIEAPDSALPTAPRAASATAFQAPRVERRSGFFAGDLEQQPLWLRALLVLALLALAGGLAYGAFRAVEMLRAGL